MRALSPPLTEALRDRFVHYDTRHSGLTLILKEMKFPTEDASLTHLSMLFS